MRPLFRRHKDNLNDEDFLLIILNEFHENGEKEVSLSEILECINMIRDKIPIGYEFEKELFYSSKLAEDLRKLSYLGYVHKFTYRYDAFLPKTYYFLTYLGKRRNKATIEKMPANYLKLLRESVKVAIDNHKKRWRFWGRSMPS